MKLYSTITSERATKGQGGNKKIVIELFNEDREKLVYIEAIPDGTNIRIFNSLNNKYYYLPSHKKEESKGNQKKDDKHVHDFDTYGKCCICGVWDTKL